jgi:hypothetical protein
MKKENACYITAWILLVFSLLSVYIGISTGRISKYELYNSDALYIPSAYRDLASGESLSEWSLQPAPSFFPDMALYFILNGVTGNFHLAIMLYGVCQSVLFVGSLLYLSRKVFGAKKNFQTLILLIGTIFFFALSSGQLDECVMILQNGHHFGATVMLVISLALIVDIVKREASEQKNRSRYVILGGLATLTLVSDLIYLIQFIIPVFISLLLLFALRRLSGKLLIFLSTALILPVGITYAADELFLKYWKPSLDSLQADIQQDHIETMTESLENIADWALFSRNFSSVIIVLWVAFVLMSIGLVIRIGVRMFKTGNGKTFRETGGLLVISCFLFSVFTNITAASVTMNSHPRYFIPTLLIPLFFGWPFLLAGWEQAAKLIDSKYVMWTLVGATLCFSLFQFRGKMKHVPALAQLSDYYPPFVQCLDKNTRDRNLRYGISSYWLAKYITMLSKNSLHVVQAGQTSDGLFIDQWINNLNWYDKDFEFIVLDTRAKAGFRTISQTRILETFGEPADIFACPSSSRKRWIFVYNQEGDKDFRQSLRHIKDFDFYAFELPSQIGRPFGLSRIAEEPTDDRGSLIYGPYLSLSIGAYYFEIHYYAKKNNTGKNVGKWDVILHAPENFETLKEGKIKKDGRNIISGVFTIRKAGSTEIRVHYYGRGTLRVDKIKIRKIL